MRGGIAVDGKERVTDRSWGRPRPRGAALAHYLVATAALVGAVAAGSVLVEALGSHLGRFLTLLSMP